MSLKEIINWNEVPEKTRVKILERPAQIVLEEQNEAIKEIFTGVIKHGDKKLREYTKDFDNVDIDSIEMTSQEVQESIEQTPEKLKDSIRNAIENIKTFHESFLNLDGISVETVSGVKCRSVTRPIEKIGLSVPAGNTPLPSTAMMLGVPSMIAGCSERILVSPPNENGLVDPTIVTVANYCNINRIFKIGGAQAIAALAFGTQTVPQVNKIFGPGNTWVTQAKRLISHYNTNVSIDMPAGPTEVLIISDGNSDPLHIAFDLLSQAEHGIDSQVILLSTSKNQLYKVQQQIKESLRTRPESAGDYCSGTNHVLPTGGFTKSLSGISVASFQKTISVQEITQKGLGNLSKDIIRLARAEGLEAHAKAVEVRMDQHGH